MDEYFSGLKGLTRYSFIWRNIPLLDLTFYIMIIREAIAVNPPYGCKVTDLNSDLMKQEFYFFSTSKFFTLSEIAF